jgi:S-(hydroxymethyl)glutathione dehydrogenase/alcohol dehydrogenase
MRAIVFDGSKAAVETSVEVRETAPTEVKVRMAAAGVCHSDLSVIDGTIPFPPPVVMGHEGAGVIEEVGSEVKNLEVGDHVVLTTLAYCGSCRECDTGNPTWCRGSFGQLNQPFTVNGDPAYQFAANSAFAEHTVVSARQAIKIDDSVPLTSACLIGCGVITGAGAALNRADIRHGQNVAVFGVGGIGLNVIQAARLCDAGRIIAVDTLPQKEELARQFGATDFVLAGPDQNPVKTIRQLTGGGGADWSFECVGHPAVIADAVKCLDWGGNCVIIGVPGPEAELTGIRVNHLQQIDRGIMGCRYGSAKPHRDVPLFIQLYLDGKLKLDELVTQTYPLEDFQKVVDDMHDGKLARGVLTF